MIQLKIDVLLRAIENHITIELRNSEKSSENVLFFSKLLAYDLAQKSILIDFPTASAELRRFQVKESVVIKFIYTDSPFYFHSVIVEPHCTNLSPEPDKPKLKLLLPEFIFGEERRQYLKLSTPPFPVAVKLVQSRDIVKQYRQPTFQSVAVNISIGGIALENDESQLPLYIGDILHMDIALPGNTIPIEGEVLNRYPFKNSQRVIFGIRFIQEKIDRVNYLRNVSRITQYIMRRERELLSKY